jgi:salicylate hydroxylase
MHPVLIDRSADSGRMIGDNRAGYMLALMPMVDPIIDELDCREAYLESSVGIDRYIAHAHTGRVLRQDRLGDLLADYGDYRGISRAALLDVLTGSDCPIAFGTTVTGLSDDGATVTLAREGQGGQPQGGQEGPRPGAGPRVRCRRHRRRNEFPHPQARVRWACRDRRVRLT